MHQLNTYHLNADTLTIWQKHFAGTTQKEDVNSSRGNYDTNWTEPNFSRGIHFCLRHHGRSCFLPSFSWTRNISYRFPTTTLRDVHLSMTTAILEVPTTDPQCLTPGLMQQKARAGTRSSRNWKCGHCGSSQTNYRVRTHDLRCKECKGTTPVRRII